VARMLPLVGSLCSRALIRSWAVSPSCSEHLFLMASRPLVAAPVAVLEHPAIFWEACPFSLASKSAACSLRHASSASCFRHLECQRTPADQPTYRYSSSHLMYATSLPHLLHPHLRLLERPLGLYVGSRKMPLRLRGHRR
jgi:hypothetical protein